jgi:hypothetical protein
MNGDLGNLVMQTFIRKPLLSPGFDYNFQGFLEAVSGLLRFNPEDLLVEIVLSYSSNPKIKPPIRDNIYSRSTFGNMDWVIQGKKPGADPDSYPLRTGSYVGGGDKWRGKEISPLMVGMEVTLSKPDGIKACFVGIPDLVHNVLMVRRS